MSARQHGKLLAITGAADYATVELLPGGYGAVAGPIYAEDGTVLTTARKAGLKLGGYVEANGQPRLLGEAKAGFALWTLDAQAKLVRLGEKAAHPLSPVFFIPIQPEALLAEASRAYGGELPAELIASIPLLLARP